MGPVATDHPGRRALHMAGGRSRAVDGIRHRDALRLHPLWMHHLVGRSAGRTGGVGARRRDGCLGGAYRDSLFTHHEAVRMGPAGSYGLERCRVWRGANSIRGVSLAETRIHDNRPAPGRVAALDRSLRGHLAGGHGGLLLFGRGCPAAAIDSASCHGQRFYHRWWVALGASEWRWPEDYGWHGAGQRPAGVERRLHRGHRSGSPSSKRDHLPAGRCACPRPPAGSDCLGRELHRHRPDAQPDHEGTGERCR